MTGPPHAVPLVSYVAYGSVTDDKRRQTPATVASLIYTLCVGGPVISHDHAQLSRVEVYARMYVCMYACVQRSWRVCR